jgi:hypothetical protein
MSLFMNTSYNITAHQLSGRGSENSQNVSQIKNISVKSKTQLMTRYVTKKYS